MNRKGVFLFWPFFFAIRAQYRVLTNGYKLQLANCVYTKWVRLLIRHQLR